MVLPGYASHYLLIPIARTLLTNQSSFIRPRANNVIHLIMCCCKHRKRRARGVRTCLYSFSVKQCCCGTAMYLRIASIVGPQPQLIADFRSTQSTPRAVYKVHMTDENGDFIGTRYVHKEAITGVKTTTPTREQVLLHHKNCPDCVNYLDGWLRKGNGQQEIAAANGKSFQMREELQTNEARPRE